jgi:hypothetical protein
MSLVRAAWLPALAPITGCVVETHWSECVREERELDLDERVDGVPVSPREVLAVVEGTYAFAAFYDDGTPVTGGGEVRRGDGPFLAVEATSVSRTSRGPVGLRGGDRVLMIDEECDSSLTVPAVGTLATDDGLVVFAFDGWATPSVTRVDKEPEWFHVEADVSPSEAEALPAPPEGGAEIGLSLQWAPDAFSHVSVWWRGDRYQQLLEGPAVGSGG